MITICGVLGYEQSRDGNYYCEIPLSGIKKNTVEAIERRFIQRADSPEEALKRMHDKLKEKFGEDWKFELIIDPPDLDEKKSWEP